MTAQANKTANKPVGDPSGPQVATTGAQPPYPFRTIVSLILLVGNLVVAAIYFHVLNI